MLRCTPKDPYTQPINCRHPNYPELLNPNLESDMSAKKLFLFISSVNLVEDKNYSTWEVAENRIYNDNKILTYADDDTIKIVLLHKGSIDHHIHKVINECTNIEINIHAASNPFDLETYSDLKEKLKNNSEKYIINRISSANNSTRSLYYNYILDDVLNGFHHKNDIVKILKNLI